MSILFESIIPTEEDIHEMLLSAAATKKVRFNGDVMEASQVSSESSSKEDVWYSKEDISSFKTHVTHAAAAHLREKGVLDQRNTRGVGAFLPYRLKNQVLFTICILEAVKKGSKPEELADISEKCSAWSKDIAIKQALQDYSEVYEEPETPFLTPEVHTVPNDDEPSDDDTRKRAVSFDDSCSAPNKKIRLSQG